MSSRPESDFARLEQLLREANERAEQQGRRAEELRRLTEEANERAEELRRLREEANERFEEAERTRQEAERTRQEAAKKARPTTFEGYIRSCHIFLSKPLRIQSNRRLTTQGSITNPKNKSCPTQLKPWTNFPILQQQIFEKVYECIPRDAEHFNSVPFLQEFGQNLCNRPLTSERGLEAYQRFAVEQPTANIISCLQQIEEARCEFNLGDDIIFESHVNNLSDFNEEVHQSLENLRRSNQQQSSKPPNADQICVYKETDGTRSLCIVVEYKPAHKLSVFNLRAGLLRADNGSMNPLEDVINRITIPTEPAEKFVYNSEWLIAAALIQTYSYMIESGLEYSYLVTGEAFIFLWIKEDEPHTLYYHLTEPNIEAEAQDEIDILLCRTAVSQTLTFCLLALGSKPRSQSWRNRTVETAGKAVIDYETILMQIPVEEKALTPPSSVLHARIHPFERSPTMLRPRKSQKAMNTCGSPGVQGHEDPQTPSGSSDELPDIETQSKPGDRTAAPSGIRQSHATKTSQAVEERDVRQRQYCTQACLLGLVRKRPLDEACPNVSAHRVHGTSNRHALEKKNLSQHIRHQLKENLDVGCEPLGKQGARGALFKLTLDSYGYTFVAKGTVEAFIPHLKHEKRIYRYLNEVQGELIPVYLGSISLVKPYFLDVGVRIVHMLLMSWAGEEAQKDLMSKMLLDIKVETNLAVTKLRDCGVEHHDVRPPNVLWNPEIRNVVLIDFERSEILKQISPDRKQKYLHSTNGTATGVDSAAEGLREVGGVL